MRNVRHNITYYGSVAFCFATLVFGASAYSRYVGDQRVSIVYDHQANMDVKSRHDGCDAARCFIVNQTADDVAHSGAFKGAYGFVPTPDSFYLDHPQVTSHYIPPRLHQRKRVAHLHDHGNKI